MEYRGRGGSGGSGGGAGAGCCEKYRRRNSRIRRIDFEGRSFEGRSKRLLRRLFLGALKSVGTGGKSSARGVSDESEELVLLKESTDCCAKAFIDGLVW